MPVRDGGQEEEGGEVEEGMHRHGNEDGAVGLIDQGKADREDEKRDEGGFVQ